MSETMEQTFALACLTAFFIFLFMKLSNESVVLQHEKMGISFDQLRLKLKETITEAAEAAHQEEIQEDIRILKERIDSVCEADIQPLKHEMRMLFDHLLSVDGYTSNGPTKRDLLNYLQKKKND
jgi:hypothetical protein